MIEKERFVRRLANVLFEELAALLNKHKVHVFHREPALDATHWHGEQAMLMSVLVTCRHHERDQLDFSRSGPN